MPRSSPTSSARSAPTSASPSCRSTSSRSAGSSAAATRGRGTRSRRRERLLPERVPNTAVISVIDLELDDAIHVGTQGLKRAGQRLARIAERELFGQVGATHADPRPRRQGTGQHAGRQVQGRQPGRPRRTDGRIPPARGDDGSGHGNRRSGHGHEHGRVDGADPVVQRRRARGHRAEARAAHRRVLDPQGRRHRGPADLRGVRRPGAGHRGPQARRRDPRRRPRSGTATASIPTAT